MKQHQEQFPLKARQTGLGERLRQSMNNLTVDVWGLENKTASSLEQYFEKVSIERDLSKDHFMIRISNKDFIVIELCHKDRIQFPIEISKLFQLLNAPVMNPSDFQKLTGKIKQFFDSYEEGKKTVGLYLNVQVVNQKVQFHLTNHDELLETLSFQKLINQISIW